MNVFYQSLQLAHRIMLQFQSLDKDKDVWVLSNYYTQSIGNREMKLYARASMVVGKHTISITLSPGFSPIRVLEDAYNGESVTEYQKTDNVHSIDENMGWNIAHKEALSRITYNVEQVLTGFVLSGESTFKLYATSEMIKVLKPKKLDISLYEDKDFSREVASFNLPRIKAFCAITDVKAQKTLTYVDDKRKDTGKARVSAMKQAKERVVLE